MAEQEQTLKFKQLSGVENYHIWCTRAEDFITTKGLSKYLEKEPSGKETELELEKFKKTKAYLTSTINDTVLKRFNKKELSAKGLWTKLENEYCKIDDEQIEVLEAQLENIKLIENANFSHIIEYIDQLTDCFMKLEAAGESITEKQKFNKLMRGLPKSFNAFKLAMSATEASNKTFDYAINKLKHAKLAIELEEETKPEEKVLHLRNQSGPSKFNQSHNFPKQIHRKGNPHKRGASNPKINGNCNICGKYGHMAKYCYTPKPYNNHIKETKKYEGLLFNINTDQRPGSENWLIDGGANIHTTPDKDDFIPATYTKEPHIKQITVANNNKTEIIGRGDVMLSIKINGVSTKLLLKDVKHCQGINQRIISETSFEEDGCQIIKENGTCNILKNGQIVLQGQKQNHKGGLYYLIQETYAVNSVSLNTWHNRLCHLNKNSVLKTQSLVRGMKIKHKNTNELCESCVMGKSTVQRIGKQTYNRQRTKLHTIHSDICGPFSTKTLSGKKYFVTFIDEYSDKCWVYLLNARSELFHTFREFKKQVETESGEVIRHIRCDNAPEYVGNPMKAYLTEHGIQLQTTAPYSPFENPIAERRNRTLCEAIRSMLHHSKLPKHFWGEALVTANHVLNHVFKSSINNVPETLWSGKQVNIGHFRTFGSLAYAHIDDSQRTKLDLKSKPCILLGYRGKTYKLLTESNKVIYSRNVTFNEGTTKASNDTEYFEAEHTENDNVPNDSDSQTITLHKFFSGKINQKEQSEKSTTNEKFIDQFKIKDAESEHDDTELRRSNRLIRKLKVNYKEESDSDESADNEDKSYHIYNIEISNIEDPKNYKEAMESKNAAAWQEAIKVETQALFDKNVFKIISKIPEGKTLVGSRYVFKTKLNEMGQPVRFKARLVAKGYSQIKNENYFDCYSPVVKAETIFLFITMALTWGHKIYQIDYDNAYVNAPLDTEIYMSLPEGFPENNGHFYLLLQKALYGLKQSGRQWYLLLKEKLRDVKWKSIVSDECVLFRLHDNVKEILIIYVDDVIIICNESRTRIIYEELNQMFKNKGLKELNHFLGMRFILDRNTILIDQEIAIKSIVKDVLNRNEMAANPLPVSEKLIENEGIASIQQIAEYQRLIGRLLHVSRMTRPDIHYAVVSLSRYSKNPSTIHSNLLHRLVAYLNKTSTLKLKLIKSLDENVAIEAYTDADWGNRQDRRSTSGYIVLINGSPVRWVSKGQNSLTMPTSATSPNTSIS